MKFTYSIPTKILFGPGSFNDLATTPLPGKKALVVITAGKSMRANGYLDRLIDMLDKQGIGHALFDKILPNPVLRHVHEGAALAREQGCDFVIGLGGGSSIDSAKSIAVMAKNPGDYWDYISGGSGKGQPLVNGALPIVAIATTAGTGTEADPWTVITKEDTNEKIGFGCAETFPVLSVVDPEMMLTIPAHLTAYQGFDALFHATEGYIANVATPLSDAYALKSIELLAKYLPAAVKDGSDLEARTQVALASTLSGMVDLLLHVRTRHGARPERFLSETAARRGADHAFRGVLFVLRRQGPRTVHGYGQGHGRGDGAPAGGRAPDGVRQGACGIAEGVRRRRPEDVRLRHYEGRHGQVRGQRAAYDGRAVRA